MIGISWRDSDHDQTHRLLKKCGIKNLGCFEMNTSRIKDSGMGMKEVYRGYLVLIGSALSFSLMSTCVKQLNGDVPVYEIVLGRAVISLLITRYMLKRQKINPWGSNRKLLFIRGLLGTAALFCIFEAINTLSLASATVIQYTYPTFTAIGAAYLMKENITQKFLYAITFGWLGVVLVAQPQLINTGIDKNGINSVFIALSGAILTALAYLCVKKLSKKEHSLVIIYYFPLVSVPICLPLILKNGLILSGESLIWIFFIGILTQIGQLLITEGLRLLPASKASCINYSQVLFAVIWGVIFFKERVTFNIIAGGSLILLSAFLCRGNNNYTVEDS